VYILTTAFLLQFPELTKAELFQLAKGAVKFIFADDKLKQTLRLIIDAAECDLLIPNEDVENCLAPEK
jgi:hypothetical protein